MDQKIVAYGGIERRYILLANAGKQDAQHHPHHIWARLCDHWGRVAGIHDERTQLKLLTYF